MATQAISIYFGTETGHSRAVAEAIQSHAEEADIEVEMHDLADVSAAQLAMELRPAVFVVSTWGGGKPPFMARRFFFELESGEIETPLLSYAVVALGDECYEDFCKCGKTLDSLLEKAGAARFMPRTDIGHDYMKCIGEWMPRFFGTLSEME